MVLECERLVDDNGLGIVRKSGVDGRVEIEGVGRLSDGGFRRLRICIAELEEGSVIEGELPILNRWRGCGVGLGNFRLESGGMINVEV
jgi:hypothetical protein